MTFEKSGYLSPTSQGHEAPRRDLLDIELFPSAVPIEDVKPVGEMHVNESSSGFRFNELEQAQVDGSELHADHDALVRLGGMWAVRATSAQGMPPEARAFYQGIFDFAQPGEKRKK
ncbi:hypothetical protein HYW36_00375 [Candidatus Saccharibacteria bacterium]|nr:hypothetical protein [Candidatus Saccharibacteria bacterium]